MKFPAPGKADFRPVPIDGSAVKPTEDRGKKFPLAISEKI